MGVEELGRVYQAELPINAGMVQFAAAARALRPVDSSAWAAATEAAHKRLPRIQLAGVQSGRAATGRDRLEPARPAAARYDRRQRRRQLRRLGASLLALSRIRHATGADQRLDGLWRSGRRGRGARASGAHGAVILGRRLLPDERPGDRDRDPVRRRADLLRGQQRHVRHDPDAPGARVPRTGERHRADQSGFRGARARLRTARRDLRAHRGFRARLRARAQVRTRRADRACASIPRLSRRARRSARSGRRRWRPRPRRSSPEELRT